MQQNRTTYQRSHLKRSLLLTALAAAALVGCKEDDVVIDDTYDRPLNAALPIVFGESTAKSLMEEWLDDTKWYADDEGLLYVNNSYETRYNCDALLHLNDINLGMDLDLGMLDEASPDHQVDVSTKQAINRISDQRLDEIVIKNGTLNVVAAPTSADGSATLTYPEILNAKGETLKISWNMKDGVWDAVDMTNFVVHPINTEEGCFITCQLHITDLDTHGTTGETVTLLNYATDMNVKSSYGYFGSYTLYDEENLSTLNIFNRDDFPAEIDFKNTLVDLTVANNVGANFLWEYEKMQFYTEHPDEPNSKAFKLDYPIDHQTFTQQPYDDYIATGIAEEVVVKQHADNENSNIADIINQHPKYYSLYTKLTCNPEGNLGTNFITDTTYFRTKVVSTTPLEVRVRYMERRERIDVDLQDLFDDGNIDYVESITLKIETNNGYPFKGRAQFFVMAGDVQVDSLLEQRELFLETAQLDANLMVTAPTKHVLEVTMDHDQVVEYYNMGVDAIDLFAVLTTEDTGDNYVKILDRYKSTTKISCEITSRAK